MVSDFVNARADWERARTARACGADNEAGVPTWQATHPENLTEHIFEVVVPGCYIGEFRRE